MESNMQGNRCHTVITDYEVTEDVIAEYNDVFQGDN